ncbi:Mycobacteriophage Barnyard protein gp56 [uncultured Synechococcales cyanobacterium]|uniref:Mycobacteriophage Barnyard protein gp56 n=1 Tax=uncultured Synechococcales cyanobacterium TaxID=1936017 RepID=A0A6J4V7N0_9CYAN|nr:Mycobacteriophage Barnyard protein gp56 [uncultured Synechococcales cyanobacterium]
MPHEFESGFFVQEPAWHRLGTILKNPPTIQQAILESGLNWKVLKESIYRLVEGQPQEIKTHKSLVRDSDQSVLGVVSNRYTPLQNHQAFSFFDFLLHEGSVTLEAAGSLKKGRKVWVLARINESGLEVQGGDEVRPYLLLHNSHDGSGAVWIQFTPIRVVCHNTLSWAASSGYQDEAAKKAIRIRHTASIQEQLAIAKQTLEFTKQQFSQTIDEYRAMAAKPMSMSLLSEYVGQILQTDSPTPTAAWKSIAQNFAAGRGNQGLSLWDAYNGVTEWLDHQRGRSEATRLESAWFGSGAYLRERSHLEALALL